MIYPQTNIFGVTADSTHTITVTGSATAHTKGAWVQVFTALAFDVFEVNVYVAGTGVNGSDTSGLLDVGADPAGGTSYTAVIPNLLIGHTPAGTNLSESGMVTVPVYIPAGATVAIRNQGIVTSDVAEVGLTVHGGIPTSDPYPQIGLVVDYGTATASSSGTTPANAIANVLGAWVELTAATTHPHRGLTVAMQGADNSFVASEFLVDIGIGAASSEVAIIERIHAFGHQAEELWITTNGRVYHRPIPEGSRLAVRAQSSAADEQDNLDVAVYGWG